VFFDIIFEGGENILFGGILCDKLVFFNFVFGDNVLEFDDFLTFDDLVFDYGLFFLNQVIGQTLDFLVLLLLLL
jgi:hypothetical protein